MNAGKRTLLVVEDDPGLQSALRWAFDGFEVVTAEDREGAIRQLRRHHPEVVTLDLGLPPDPGGASEGLATLEEILALAPQTKVIVVTGNDDRDNAVRAVELGAWLFCQKPVDAQLLVFIVERAYRLYGLERESQARRESAPDTPLAGIIATSPEMLEVCATIEKVAPANVTTLLTGASGTGKELLARALHALSPRAGKRFAAINCAAIPDTLLESELFGYEKGAFTGANARRVGHIENAHGGTLFLDEIGDLPMPLQAKLLRFLQERVIVRVGGREEIPVDVRVVCATHRDLEALLRTGTFREDLYYRVSEVTIRIPTLHERRGEAVVLARHFLDRRAREHGRNGLAFTDDAVRAIESHAWPGNVRELENRINRAVILAEGRQITARELELEPGDAEPMPFSLRQVRENAERQAMLRALRYTDGNVSQAAELLGITRPTFYALANKYRLDIGRGG